MKQYISKKDLNYLASVEAQVNTEAEEFAKKLEDSIKSIFPNSFVQVRYNTGLGSHSIFIRFAVGKDKSEWPNGIINNDPLHHHLWVYGVNKDGSLQDVMQTDISIGGSIILKGTDETGFRSPIVKIGFRKMKGSSDKIIQGLTKYFQKAKAVLKQYKDQVREDDFIGDKV